MKFLITSSVLCAFIANGSAVQADIAPYDPNRPPATPYPAKKSEKAKEKSKDTEKPKPKEEKKK